VIGVGGNSERIHPGVLSKACTAYVLTIMDYLEINLFPTVQNVETLVFVA